MGVVGDGSLSRTRSRRPVRRAVTSLNEYLLKEPTFVVVLLKSHELLRFVPGPTSAFLYERTDPNDRVILFHYDPRTVRTSAYTIEFLPS